MIQNVNKMKDKAALEILTGNFSGRGAFVNRDEIKSGKGNDLAIKRAKEWRAQRVEDEKNMDSMINRSAELKKLIDS